MRGRVAVVVAVVGMVVVGGAGPASGSGLDDPPAPGVQLLSPAEALAQDATALAEKQGVSADVMTERLRFQAAVDELRRSWPASILEDVYAGGAMAHTPERPGAILYFKGPVPTVVEQQLLVQRLAGVQLVGGQRFSLNELRARQRAVHDAVVRQGFASVRSASDVATQRIEVEVVPVPGGAETRGAHAVRDAALAALAGTEAAVGAAEVEVTVRPAGTQLIELEHGYGGAGVHGDDRFCTSAFSVRRNSDGLKGYVTAAHCERITTMQQNNAAGGVDLEFSSPFVSEHIGARGDLEWHHTAHDSFPEFWSSSNQRRPVYARVSNVDYDLNDDVCHYGRTTGYSCGTVYDESVSFTFPWEGCGYCVVTAHDMVEVAGATSDDGDSGGPWFSGNTAYGIHTGLNLISGHKFFSKIQNAEIQFGVTVMMA